MDDLPKQGKITEGLFARILLYVHSTKMTGTVGLSKGDVKKVISFSSGLPVSARSNVVNETLGKMLVDTGRLTQTQLDESVKDLKSSENILLGQYLIDKGIINPAELEDFLKKQLLQRIKNVLFWSEGEYKIVEGKLADPQRVSLGMNIPEIIFHASRTMDDLSLLRAVVPLSSKPVKGLGSELKIEDMKVSGKELSIYRLINGATTVEKMISESKTEEKTLLSFLHALLRVGLISIHTDAPKRTEQTARPETKPQNGVAESSAKIYAEIQRRLKDIEGKNFFEYFGVTLDDPSDKLKNSYFGFAKTYHPDKLPKDFSDNMRKEGETLFSRMTEAYNVLSDALKRDDYVQKLQSGVSLSQNPSVIAESELEFRKGQVLLKKGDFEGAVELFKRAVALYPEEAEYYIHLGWAFFKKGIKTKQTALISNAKVEIEKGLNKNANADRGYLYLGHIAKYEKSPDKAKRYYQKAVEVNPKCLEAASELRLMGGVGAKPGDKGAF